MNFNLSILLVFPCFCHFQPSEKPVTIASCAKVCCLDCSPWKAETAKSHLNWDVLGARRGLTFLFPYFTSSPQKHAQPDRFETSFHECSTAKGLASIEVTVRLPTIKGLQPAKAGSNSPNSRGFSRCPMSHPNHPNVPLERGLDARAPSPSTSIRDFLWWHVQVSPTH